MPAPILPRRSPTAMSQPSTGSAASRTPFVRPQPGGNAARRSPRHSSRVLLAFCETAERDLFANLLTRHGHAIDCCENGQEALDRIAAQPFGLVVTGISMPRMDGLELIRVIYQRYPGLPVIAITKGTDRMDQVYQRSAMVSGASAAHSLPLNSDRFLVDVEQAL